MSWYDKLNEPSKPIEIYDSAYTKKDFGELVLSTQPVYANHEFTIIDDTDPNFVVVEDETGMVRTIPREKKNDSSAWIVAAVAAGLMLL